MLHIFKAGLVSLILSLATCVYAEDIGQVKASSEQNKIQQGQRDQKKEVKKSVSLVGVVANLSTGKSVVNSTVKIKIDGVFGDPVAITSGAFQIDNISADADYELVIHSSTNAFVDKTFFGKTRASNSLPEVYQDLGVLAVAANAKYLNTDLSLSSESQLLASSH